MPEPLYTLIRTSTSRFSHAQGIRGLPNSQRCARKLSLVKRETHPCDAASSNFLMVIHEPHIVGVGSFLSLSEGREGLIDGKPRLGHHEYISWFHERQEPNDIIRSNRPGSSACFRVRPG